jgi:glycosyltransferase involved in cell wall biosynthesis
MLKNYSIIIPHYNTPDLLERCIRSIPEREDIDVFVIDDNSDSQYITQIRQLCQRQKNVILTLTKEGKGAGYARNIALAQVHSKWVLFADADDYFLPEAWTYLDKHLQDEADIIYFYSTCRYSDTNEPGNRHLHLAKLLNEYTDNPNEMTEGHLRYNYNEPWGKMIRASIIQNNAITFEETRWANDLHFSTVVGACAKSITVDHAEIYCVTIAHGSLVHQHSLESRRCRYETILRNNAYLRQIGKAQFQDSLMYSLKWAAKLGGIKAVIEFIKLGHKYKGDFTIGVNRWIKNFFISRNEYKNKDKYIVKN